MFAGTCLKGANAVYFGNTLDFLYEFVPMVVFAVSLFVYMVFCKFDLGCFLKTMIVSPNLSDVHSDLLQVVSGLEFSNAFRHLP